MISIIIPYENPDLDGVACVISLAALEPTIWQPKIIGSLDAETMVVLDHLGLSPPETLRSYNDVQAIWLVDTHYAQTSPTPTPADLVLRITDHHPSGSGSHFPNAKVQNEPVGAAATLVTERYLEEGVRIDPKTAVLLQAAILSNTLEFQAPATALRDRVAFEYLRRIEPLDEPLKTRMQSARRMALDAPSAEIFQRGVKLFPTVSGTIAIAQIEAPGAAALLERPDLDAALATAAQAANAASAIWNIVDTAAQTSAILCTDQTVLQKISKGLGQPASASGRLHVGRILQRKTDIVPFVVP